MHKSTTIHWTMAAVAAAMMALSACKPKQVAHSRLSGTAAGHEIKADIEGVGGIIGHNNRTFIQLPGHELDIEAERVLLDGNQTARVPVGARLEIVLANSTLSVAADGTNVLTTTIKK